jgi:hypothetical protein
MLSGASTLSRPIISPTWTSMGFKKVKLPKGK